jgi:hypothetical protein
MIVRFFQLEKGESGLWLVVVSCATYKGACLAVRCAYDPADFRQTGQLTRPSKQCGKAELKLGHNYPAMAQYDQGIKTTSPRVSLAEL